MKITNRARSFSLALSDLLSVSLQMLAAGDLMAAYQFADRACRFGGVDDAHALLVRATVLFRRGFLEQAIEDLQAALLMKPGNRDIALSLIGMCDADLNRFRATFRQALTELLKHSPQLSLNNEMADYLNRGGWNAMGCAWRDGEFVVGWAVKTGDPLARLTIELDGRLHAVATELPTPWLSAAGIGDGRNGFRIKLPPVFAILRLGIEGVNLWGSPFSGGLKPIGIDIVSSLKDLSAAVDIIVPVYSGYEETLACLDSIKASVNRTPYRVIVVDDCSPDEKLREVLKQRAANGEIALVTRRINSGFSGAVNTGLMLDQSRDAILLNADTLVFGDWLDRLRAIAYRSGDIGTVTPISNHAELLSHPTPKRENPIIDVNAAARIDALFDVLAVNEPVDIPVGVGFCLYIKRQALNAVGLFDEEHFSRGYGEDTDFCIRMSANGWRNVCAANTFVVHWGSKSFGAEKRHLVAKNIPFLLAKYPQHSSEYRRFLDDDPLYDIRRSVQRKWLAIIAPAYRGILYVGSSVKEDEVGFSLLLGEKDADQWRVNLLITGLTGLDKIGYRLPSQFSELEQDITAAGFERLEFKIYGSWPAEIVDRLTSGLLPYHFQLVDYSAYCPRRYRIDCNAARCDDPLEQAVCTDCVSELGPLVYGYSGIEAWRERALRIFSKANEISAESGEILAAFVRRYPMLEPLTTAAHLYSGTAKVFDFASERSETVRIAVLSAASLDEGYLLLLEQAKAAVEADRRLEFIVFGVTMNDQRLRQLPNIYLAGRLDESKVSEQLLVHACDAVANFSLSDQKRIEVERLADQNKLPVFLGL